MCKKSVSEKVVQGMMVGILAFAGMGLFAGCVDPSGLEGRSEDGASDGARFSTGEQAPVIPLRISRDFFEAPVEATLTVAEAGETTEYESKVSWVVHAPTSPAPTGDYIADFRDRSGCAELYDLPDQAQLCFTVMPDVSSLDVTAERVALQNAQALVSNASCTVKPQEITLVRGQKAQGELNLEFQVASPCLDSPVNLSLKLQQR